MWEFTIEDLSLQRGRRVAVRRDSGPLPYGDVLRLWQEDDAFTQQFIRQLTDAPFAAFRWETLPITLATANRPFEFVLLDSPALERSPDPDSFAEHFQAPGEGSIIAFANLGNDAMPVVPRPSGPQSSYAHLAAFLRTAPTAQARELWRIVGRSMQSRLGARPIWLSTAGMGVAWLHVRLDSRPKYYGFTEYARGA